MPRTLIIYTFHQPHKNVEFFFRHGLLEHPDIDYHVVINNPTYAFPYRILPRMTVVNRANQGHDFGGWAAALHSRAADGRPIWQAYDYYILINSSCRGPFLPVWTPPGTLWPSLFTQRLNAHVKLVGPTMGIAWGTPHVQSFCLATDSVGIRIGVEQGILPPVSPNLSHHEIIRQKELGFSKKILEAGYQIGSLLKLHTVEGRLHVPGNLCPYLRNAYYGINTHPYEVIFPKYRNDVCDTKVMDLLTDWFDNAVPLVVAPQPAPLVVSVPPAVSSRPPVPVVTPTPPPAPSPGKNYFIVEAKRPKVLSQVSAVVNAVLLARETGRNLVFRGQTPVKLDNLNSKIKSVVPGLEITNQVPPGPVQKAVVMDPLITGASLEKVIPVLKMHLEPLVDLGDTSSNAVVNQGAYKDISSQVFKMVMECVA